MDKVRDSQKIKAHSDALFLNLVEQVKTPFVQISHASEMLGSTSGKKPTERLRREIYVTSKSALQLIDGYLLSVELQRDAEMTLETVSISSVLYDTAQSLQDYAAVNGCEIELDITGKFPPAIGHRQVLLSALVSLGYGLIEACTKLHDSDIPRIRLSVSRSGKGFRTGIYMNKPIPRSLLTQARSLMGSSHQPFASIDSTNGSGILIADSLLELLHTPLRIAQRRGYYGFAATLMPSRQLSLV